MRNPSDQSDYSFLQLNYDLKWDFLYQTTTLDVMNHPPRHVLVIHYIYAALWR